MKRVALQGKLAEKGVQTASALVVYSVLSLFYFGTSTLRHISQVYLGTGTDPTIYMWSLTWWPHALANHLNPFITRVLWAPTGYNLAWATSMPGPSLLMSPITKLFGPVVSYNILCLLCPATAAFSAFLLCHYVCRRFWPALLGGYIFGFSPYVLCQILGHLVLLFIFAIPLAAYLVLRRLNGEISQRALVGLLVALLLFHFLSSTEIFATTTVFGVMALALSCALGGKEMRHRLVSVTREIGCAYALLTVLLAPYLYYLFARGIPNPFNPATSYSNDVLAFLVPPPVILVGGQLFSSLAHHLPHVTPWDEEAAYLGPGLWLTILLFAWSYWRTKAGKLLILTCGLIALMSLGPVLHLAGDQLIPMPWWLLNRLPLLDQALPGRFGMYLFLVAALIAAIYLSDADIQAWSKTLLGGLCLLFIAPRLSFVQSVAITKVDTPAFFRYGAYKHHLAKGDNVLILPQGEVSNSLLWQAQSGFYFGIATGRIGITPAEFSSWPVFPVFQNGSEILDFTVQLDAFLGAYQVKAIIVDPRAEGLWAGLLSKAGMQPLLADGVLFYKTPPTVLTSFQSANAHQMVEREMAISFAALIGAANQYLDGGFPLAKLTPWKAQRLNLLNLPRGDARPVLAYPQWWRNLWLGAWGDSMVGVGIVGNCEDLRPLVDEYGGDAADIFFPFPHKLADGLKQGTGQLLMVFTPQGLQRAASKAERAAKDSTE